MNDLPLLGPAEIRELAEMLGIRPTKTLGQNFVIDPNTIRRIVNAAEISPEETVLEVGPGLGSLTLGILDAAKDMVRLRLTRRWRSSFRTRLRSSAPRRRAILTWCLWMH